MPHAVWEPSAGDSMGAPRALALAPPSGRLAGEATSAYDGASFAAGRDCGTRVAACVARLAALELVEGSRWWNRRSRRRMASALVACAEELERDAECGRA